MGEPGPLRDLARVLLFAGGVLLALGAVVWLAGGTGGLGRLPGDFVVRRGRVTLYLPLATSLVISVVLTLLLWLVGRR